jgi:hypothetical protein
MYVCMHVCMQSSTYNGLMAVVAGLAGMYVCMYACMHAIIHIQWPHGCSSRPCRYVCVYVCMHAIIHIQWPHCGITLIFIMIGFCLAKKENIVVPNAVEKSRTGAFRSHDQTLSFFFRLKKNNHHKNESSRPGSYVCMYVFTHLLAVYTVSKRIPAVCMYVCIHDY